MDFHLDEELLAVQGLARDILTDRAATDRVRSVEQTETRVDDSLWADLARAGLLGIALPEEHGGAGLGLGGLCVLLEEQGRTVALVPLWAAGVAGLAVAAHGSESQRATLLPGLVDGSLRLTLAVEEYDGAHPVSPRCTATPSDNGWTLEGTKAVVPSSAWATTALASATTPEGPALFLIDLDAEGVAVELTETTSRDRAANLQLADAPAELLGEPGGPAVPWVLDRAAVALAAIQLGVAEGALRLAATYLSDRQQFGRPLATFQAVQHQLADCYIDIDAMRVTLWQAVTSLEDQTTVAGAERAVLVAKWWADQAGLDVVHRVQHLHGGIGVDVDYPVHRYFLWGKQVATTLGGSAAALADLGARLAVEEVVS